MAAPYGIFPSDVNSARVPSDPTLGTTNNVLSTATADNKKLLWVGRISHVDVESMKCSIITLTDRQSFHDVPLTAAGGSGPRSFAGMIPERGTMVIVGWTKYSEQIQKPVIVDYIATGASQGHNFNAISTMDPEIAKAALLESPELIDDPEIFWEPIRVKLKKVYGGDFLASASRGADLSLDRDVHLVNRTGVEVRLRDSDQTIVTSTINEFTSNAAGYYHRGMIKRSALSFQNELYPLNSTTNVSNPWDVKDQTNYGQKIPKDSPAFNSLYNLKLINDDGSPTFGPDQGYVEYPYVVLPDGTRTNYVFQGDSSQEYSAESDVYIEDRKELRHVSRGILAVTEETDGFNIDLDPISAAAKEKYIEDVHGTVVGNDFSEVGRPYYKRVLYMRLFNSIEDRVTSAGPEFGYVGSSPTEYNKADDIALARYYKIQSPTTNNQYVFAINKQGKVYLHVPAVLNSDTEKGQSVEANIKGLVKAVIGQDPVSKLSTDLTLEGGMNLFVGRGAGPKKTDSVYAEFSGPVRFLFKGDTGTKNPKPTFTTQTLGSSARSISASNTDIIGGSNVLVCGGESRTEAQSIVSTANSRKDKTTGAAAMTYLDNCDYNHAAKVTCSLSTDRKTTMVAGVDSKTVLSGGVSTTIIAGTGWDLSVGAGSVTSQVTVTAGNMSLGCSTGNMSATVGSGNLSLSCLGGPISMSSGVTTTIMSSTSNLFSAPVTSIGLATVGFAVAGLPGPAAPAIDYVTGLPLVGIPTLSIG